MTAASSVPTVACLFIHPIKSGRAIQTKSAELDAFGFVGDRRWIVVDEHGTFLTQRTVRTLSLLDARIATNSRSVSLSAPGNGSLTVESPPDGMAIRRVVVWNDHVDVVDWGDACAEWLTRLLERPARLVSLAPAYSRPVWQTTFQGKAGRTPEASP
ncbi:MAG TPA: MOSC domain-containing protein [Opitutaceae bacterium]